MAHFIRSNKRRKTFLDCLADGDSPSLAAATADGPLRAFNKWAADDPDFKADWDEALEAGTDHLEDVATKRAKEKSDPLMIMMLKARRPDKFDRAQRVETNATVHHLDGSKNELLMRLAKLRNQTLLSAPSDEG